MRRGCHHPLWARLSAPSMEMCALCGKAREVLEGWIVFGITQWGRTAGWVHPDSLVGGAWTP